MYRLCIEGTRVNEAHNTQDYDFQVVTLANSVLIQSTLNAPTDIQIEVSLLQLKTMSNVFHSMLHIPTENITVKTSTPIIDTLVGGMNPSTSDIIIRSVALSKDNALQYPHFQIMLTKQRPVEDVEMERDGLLLFIIEQIKRGYRFDLRCGRYLEMHKKYSMPRALQKHANFVRKGIKEIAWLRHEMQTSIEKNEAMMRRNKELEAKIMALQDEVSAMLAGDHMATRTEVARVLRRAHKYQSEVQKFLDKPI